MESLLSKIQHGAILVSDGAWGTFLHQKGLEPGECPELWNDTHPDDVLDIAKSYINAGADMIETNSFGGSRFKLEHYGLADRAAELNEKAATISRKAAGDDHYVLGSIGPTGKMLMMGDVTEDEWLEAFTVQAVALANGGADAIIVETMSALDEASAAIRAAKDNTDLPVICTMTFEKTVNNDYRSMMGVSPEDAASALKAAGADVIGTNCGNGIEQMIDIVKTMRAVDYNIPILVHANAGAPQVQDGKTFFPEGPADTAKWVQSFVEAGGNIIGGCCGTTPEHIQAIRNEILIF